MPDQSVMMPKSAGFRESTPIDSADCLVHTIPTFDFDVHAGRAFTPRQQPPRRPFTYSVLPASKMCHGRVLACVPPGEPQAYSVIDAQVQSNDLAQLTTDPSPRESFWEIVASGDLTLGYVSLFDWNDVVKAEQRSQLFSKRISEHLRSAYRSAIASQDHPLPSSEAMQVCLRVAEVITPIAVAAPDLRMAAFDNTEGGVALVVHSITHRRRINLEMLADGLQVEATATDEHLASEEKMWETEDLSWATELAEWLVGMTNR